MMYKLPSRYQDGSFLFSNVISIPIFIGREIY